MLGVSSEELMHLLGDPLYESNAILSGFRKLILGSDAYIGIREPFLAAQKCYEYLMERIGLPRDIRDDIMGGTAAKWLGLGI